MRHLRTVGLAVLISLNAVGQKNDRLLKQFVADPALASGFAGVHIVDANTGKKIIDYNASKYFLPSSTAKLFTTYAALKYIKDSLPAAYTAVRGDTFYFRPTGDPTLLHPKFSWQPLIDTARKFKYVVFDRNFPNTENYAAGWSWDDYQEDFMAERSAMPVYGNTVWIEYLNDSLVVIPDLRSRGIEIDSFTYTNSGFFRFVRFPDQNKFSIEGTDEKFSKQRVPLIMTGHPESLDETLLMAAIGKQFSPVSGMFPRKPIIDTLKGYHLDSILQPMLHNSDNFLAEQLLLMSSEKAIRKMSDTLFINRLLDKELNTIPDKPRWVDGSGLSRYNLFTPRDLTYILKKLEKDFGEKRIEALLPTGGEGTLKLYYQSLKGKIFAKTGSMSNHTSIAGVLITRSGKRLHFSVMCDNFIGKGAEVRRAIERLITAVADSN